MDCSFCTVREKRSACANEEATGGDRRKSFCNGSRRFSKLSALELRKQSTIAELKLPLDKSCSSTLAVSSWSLQSISHRVVALQKLTYQTKIASNAVTCQYWSASKET